MQFVGINGYFHQVWKAGVTSSCVDEFLFISFIWEKLLSTEAVATGIDRLTVASVFMFGNILLSIISFVANSINCNFMFSLGCLAINWRKVFHSVVMSGEHCFFYHFLTLQCLCGSVYAIMGQQCANWGFSIMGQIVRIRWNLLWIEYAQCWQNISRRSKTAWLSFRWVINGLSMVSLNAVMSVWDIYAPVAHIFFQEFKNPCSVCCWCNFIFQCMKGCIDKAGYDWRVQVLWGVLLSLATCGRV